VSLGSRGGTLRRLTRAELLDLEERSPAFDLQTLARALGIADSTAREMIHRGDIEALGIPVLRLGREYQFPASDVLRVLGIRDTDGENGA
jgi:excisionase family DNA binding protein